MFLKNRGETEPREVLSEKNLARIGIPRAFFNSEIDDYIGNDEETKRIVKKYIENIHDMFEQCVNLTFFGSNGNGKTFLTSIILKNAYRYRYTARRIILTRFIDLAFKSNKTEDELLEIKNIYNAEFLVIDEVGKEYITAKGSNIVAFEELMKYREELGYPTIICTNLNLEDLKERYGNTIDSLIKQSLKFEMEDEDFRFETFKNKKVIQKLLSEDE